MQLTKKALITTVVLATGSLAGAAFAATHAQVAASTRPKVSVDTTVRREPPELEVGADVVVKGPLPKPRELEARVFFDREGIADGPQLDIIVTILGEPIGVSYWYDPEEIPKQSPLILRVLDKACETTGLC